MNRSELVDALAEECGISGVVALRAVEAIFNPSTGIIAEELAAGGMVMIEGFGRFDTAVRAARTGTSPQKTKTVYPRRRYPKLVIGMTLRRRISGPRGQG